eukprot:4148480-Amphidinium_carterae.2
MASKAARHKNRLAFANAPDEAKGMWTEQYASPFLLSWKTEVIQVPLQCRQLKTFETLSCLDHYLGSRYACY